MLVERLTYSQAAVRYEEALAKVERLEDELHQAQRSLRFATVEMHHALFERLKEPLP